MHGEKAHSRYFVEDAFRLLTGGENKVIPFGKLEDFYNKYLK